MLTKFNDVKFNARDVILANSNHKNFL